MDESDPSLTQPPAGWQRRTTTGTSHVYLFVASHNHYSP